MKITEQEYAALMRDRGGRPAPTPNPKPSKYHAVMEECQGIKFQSKKEARHFRELQARRALKSLTYREGAKVVRVKVTIEEIA